MDEAPGAPAQRIGAVTLDERTVVRRSPAIEHEREAAIADLLEDNRFTPVSGRVGPFQIELRVTEDRLAMEVRAPADEPGGGPGETIVLPLAPFGRIIKDYFLVCESHHEAIRGHGLARIEAIDVGRRSLHDEGAALLIERLAGKVAIDHPTARRLFTLLCALHLRA